MAEHTITLTEEQEKAGVVLLGSTEAITAELQRICDYTANPWVLKVAADNAAATATEAATMKEKYEKLDAAKKAEVDAILSSAAVEAPGNEEPIEG